MSLATHRPLGLIPTAKPEAARAFYEQTLGLQFAYDVSFAIVFFIGPDTGMMLRLFRVQGPEFAPVPYTVFGWETDRIEQTVEELTENGVVFERFPYFEQDEHGIWTAPNGEKVAWFKDPDGNTLSLSQHLPR